MQSARRWIRLPEILRKPWQMSHRVESGKTFMIGDHDFTKLLLIPDAYLLHEFPEPDDSEGNPKVGEMITLFVQTWYCNQLHNILILFDVLPNFPFATSETRDDYYL